MAATARPYAPHLRSVHAGFMEDEVALEQGFFFRMLRIYPVTIIIPMLHSHFSIV
jgi:hypothetical protein